MLYFTSDLHLGDEKVLISRSGRPFSNIEEMNNTIIANINSVVGADDELWILGDFAFRVDKVEVQKFRNRINCRNVHLVYGNHDQDYSQERIFQSVQYYKELKTPYGIVVLFHYPIMEWYGASGGTIHLHGHIHSPESYNEENARKYLKNRVLPYGHHPRDINLPLRIYDVGVDANKYKPVSLEAIANYLKVKINT